MNGARRNYKKRKEKKSGIEKRISNITLKYNLDKILQEIAQKKKKS